VGTSLSWQVPNPWDQYVELIGEIVNADGGEEAPILGGPNAENPAVLAHLKYFTDIGETHVVEVENGVLHHRLREARDDADATVKLTRKVWDEIVTGAATMQGRILAGDVDVDGSRLALLGFFSQLDDFDPSFAIVTP